MGDPFDTIDAAILAAHPGATLRYFQPVEARVQALNGFVVAAVDEPVPHWLVVSRGFTELHDESHESK